MEFVVKQSALQKELGFVQGIVEKKSTIPVLSNILMESVGENTIRIIGTDLDTTVRCEVEAEIKTAGAICVQARKLFDIVRNLPDINVRFKREENDWATVEAGRANFRLAGVASDQFPEVPQGISVPLHLPSKIFQSFIQNTSFAITQEQSRYTLSGAKFIVAADGVKMITTDGHRLAYIATREGGENAVNGDIDTLIPKKALGELIKLAREHSGSIMFGEDTNHLYFEVGGRLLISRKLSGQFPNYEMVLPKENDKSAVFDYDELRSVIRRVAVMADDRTRAVKMNFKPNEVHISSSSAEEGEAVEIVPIEYSGEEVTVGFNFQYLQEFLNVVNTSGTAETDADGEEAKPKGKVIFEFKDGNAQAQLRPVDSIYDYKYVVMPMRV